MLKFLFLLKQYIWLLFFIASAFGFGKILLCAFRFPVQSRSPSIYLLTITTGIGVMIVALFGLGNLGMLTSLYVSLLLCLGLVGNALSFWNGFQKDKILIPTQFRLKGVNFKKHWFLFGLIAILYLRYLIRPLQIPESWDELMYHLPIAKAWAESGFLTVETWLRYPIFPYNFNLLYAASLIIADDVFTHMLHMLAGILTVALVVVASKRWLDFRGGVLAALILFMSIKSQMGNANIDMGILLFFSFGLYSLALFHEKRDARYLYLSGFLVALSVGTKYQALLYLPIYGILVLLIERRPKVLATLVFIFLVFGGYWYARNYLISGDPFHPIGGRWFGYWLWNEGDVQLQFADFDHRKKLPGPALFVGFFALLYLRNSSALLKALYFAAVGSFLLWLFASGYRRYFIPAMPLLALLSGYTLVRTYDIVGATRLFKSRTGKRVFNALGIAILSVGMVGAIDSSREYWGRIAVDSESRENMLTRNLSSYDILRKYAQDEQVWPIYQLGFEDEIYYMPCPVIGDHFGPGRYRDLWQFSQNGKALASKLRSLGVGGILINTTRYDMNFDFDDEHFEFISNNDHAELYFLKTDEFDTTKPDV